MLDVKSIVKYYGTILLRAGINIFNLCPIKKNRLVFYSFNGKQYSCNPRVITEYIDKNVPGTYEIIWAFKDPEKFRNKVSNNIKIVRYRSLYYYYLAKTARVVIYNVQGYGELCRRKNQEFIQTWHASNGYKKSGAFTGIRRKLELLYHKDYSFVLSGANSMTVRRIKGTMGFNGPVIPGTPRMDLLINKEFDGVYRKIYQDFKLDVNKKIALYAPTWRNDRNENDYGIDYEALKNALEHRFAGEWVILVRLHANVYKKVEMDLPFVYDATSYDDMQELLSLADALISDYSSCIWDYSFLNRPCFLFCNDLDAYGVERNFDIPIHKWRFPVSRNVDELIEEIHKFDELAFAEAMEKHHEEMGSLEDGKATKRVYELIQNICMKT